MYDIFKAVHVVGVILLVGNVTVSAIWKVFADRTRNVAIIGHAQRLITLTDWSLTSSGIVLILIGGYGAAYFAGDDVFQTPWLVVGQLLFGLSGLIWLSVLIPLQIQLARISALGSRLERLPDIYDRLNRAWLVWGIVATIPLVAAVFVMVHKPAW